MESGNHLCLVPFVAEPDDTRFLQLSCQPQGEETLTEGTVIMNNKLSAEEREILQRFEQGELRSATSAPHEMEVAHQAVREPTPAATSDLSADEQACLEEDARLDWEAARYITENGPFAPGDTMFAIAHYSEDRLVWFDILSVTLDDIMRECAFPEDQRPKRRMLGRSFAKHFLRFHNAPEGTIPLLQE